jgi:GH25 family lysozyme M1 (1,4-beta-N-acetylmuramidase)
MKRALKKAAMFFTATIIALTYLPIISAASSEIVEWNGRSRLQSGVTYVIHDRIRLAADLVIPEGVIVEVRRDGALLLGRGMTLTINGALMVRYGGVLEIIDGDIDVRRPGLLSINGTFEQPADSVVNLSGGTALDVHNRGRYAVAGVLNILAGAEARNRGLLEFAEGSAVTLRGDLISYSGASLIIARGGAVRNDGTFTLLGGSEFINSGTLRNSARGVFTDKSHEYPDEAEAAEPRLPPVLESYHFTTAILADEPRVELRGIDVSFWQGDIDWERVAASDVDFAILRAGRGEISASRPMTEDVRFREYIEGAQANGIDVGVYFYSYALTPAEARAEAEFLVSIISDYEITYPIVFDLEDPIHERLSRAQNSAIVDAFFEVLKAHGYFPMLYSYKNFLEDRIEQRILDTYAVWVAHWHVRSTNYIHPYHIWQFTDSGAVAGINGGVDLNISYYDFPEILRKHGLNNLS